MSAETGSSPLWLAANALLLASGSVTRRALLEAAGLPVETERPDVDERAVEAALEGRVDPPGLALALARAKAMAVARRRPGRLVVGADQVLALGAEVLHKPADRVAAASHLARLSGREHRLHSAVVLARAGEELFGGVETATLHVRALAPAVIARYLAAAGDVVLSSVGAYQVEGLGQHLFERIEGEHSVILGLPMLSLLAALRAQGAVP